MNKNVPLLPKQKVQEQGENNTAAGVVSGQEQRGNSSAARVAFIPEERCLLQGRCAPHLPFLMACTCPSWPQLCVEMLRADRGILGEPTRVGVPAGE